VGLFGTAFVTGVDSYMDRHFLGLFGLMGDTAGATAKGHWLSHNKLATTIAAIACNHAGIPSKKITGLPSGSVTIQRRKPRWLEISDMR
jgi:hypothetical protein